MRKVLFSVVLLAPLVCAAQSASDLFERSKAAWHRCLLAEVAKYDDGVSTASDVARGVATAGGCGPQYDVMVAMMDIPDDARQRALVETRRAATTQQAAVPLVLQHRAAARQTTPAPAPKTL